MSDNASNEKKIKLIRKGTKKSSRRFTISMDKEEGDSYTILKILANTLGLKIIHPSFNDWIKSEIDDGMKIVQNYCKESGINFESIMKAIDEKRENEAEEFSTSDITGIVNKARKL